ncbi:MAG: hypothetical protein ACKOI2_14425 [Actinomycetota bacterium]
MIRPPSDARHSSQGRSSETAYNVVELHTGKGVVKTNPPPDIAVTQKVKVAPATPENVGDFSDAFPDRAETDEVPATEPFTLH